MVLAAEINLVVYDCSSAVYFEPSFVIPKQLAVLAEAVNMMVQPAGDDAITGNRRRRFETVLAFELPDFGSVRTSKRVRVTVS